MTFKIILFKSSHREEAPSVDGGGPAAVQAQEHGRGEAGDMRSEGLLLRGQGCQVAINSHDFYPQPSTVAKKAS